tara:strand:+ start:57 stop:509 length:453 start_codon:yes stop_codon:yes gene_type:complete
MNKREFTDRLIRAAKATKRFTESLDYVSQSLPDEFTFTIFISNDPNREEDLDEEIKILGGRKVKRGKIINMPAVTAGKYLWVDGKVPEWVNICAVKATGNTTEFELTFTHRLTEADVNKLYPDFGMPEGNDLVPFRIRGPDSRDWERNNA